MPLKQRRCKQFKRKIINRLYGSRKFTTTLYFNEYRNRQTTIRFYLKKKLQHGNQEFSILQILKLDVDSTLVLLLLLLLLLLHTIMLWTLTTVSKTDPKHNASTSTNLMSSSDINKLLHHIYHLFLLFNKFVSLYYDNIYLV